MQDSFDLRGVHTHAGLGIKMRFARNGTRRGVSPVLATVLLIAITLIAAVAMAGMFFGLLNTFTTGNQFSGDIVIAGGTTGTSTTTTATSTSSASTSDQVTVTGVTCTSSGKTKSKCTLDLLNGGASKAVVSKNGCLVEISGVLVSGTNPSKTINAGKSASVVCTVTGVEPPVGSAASGFVGIQGGPLLPFSGSWS